MPQILGSISKMGLYTHLMIRVIALTLLASISFFAQARGKFSVLQGATSNTVTNFTVVLPIFDTYQFEVIDTDYNSYVTTKSTEAYMPDSPWYVQRLRYENLSHNRQYVLLIKDEKGKVLEARSFGLLDLHAKTGKVGLASCMLKALHNYQMWDTMRAEENRPDLFLFIGDAVYLDRINPLVPRRPETELEIWNEFVATRNALDFYFWDHLVPVFSVWDDHDAGGDGVTAANYPLLPKVRKIYDAFFANDAIDGFLEQGPGLSLNFKLYGQNFIILDGRSYRDLDSKGPMFGQTQEEWAISKVSQGSNVMVNGVQFFGKHLQKDSFEFTYPNQFYSFMKNLKAIGDKKSAVFTFASGDLHFSELMRLETDFFGYPAFEITSSSAHSSTIPGRHVFRPNPRRIAATSTHNIVNLELANVPGHFAANVKSLSWTGKVLFEEFVSTAGLITQKGPQQICSAFLKSNI